MLITSKQVGSCLVFLLGIFSTMQILTLGGITIFNILSIIVFLYFLCIRRSWYSKCLYLKVCVFLLLLGVTTMGALLGDVLSISYKSRAIISFINYVIIFAVFFFIHVDQNEFSEKFLCGFKVSCYVQIFWCVLQLILYYTISLDINHIIFAQFFGTTSQTSRYVDGVLACTGLSWHPANLIPVLIYIFLFNKGIVLKLLCIAISVFSHSATAQIAIGLCCCYVLAKWVRKAIGSRIPLKYWFGFSIFVIIFCAYICTKNNLVVRTINSILERIRDIYSIEPGNSSATHFSYYTRLFAIIRQSNVFTVLFGYGIDCSGFPFSYYYNQYSDMVWVVESDFVNIVLSQGLVGFIVFYAGFLSITVQYLKKSKSAAVFMLVLFVCGITYNLQFNWVILVELILFSFIKKTSTEQVTNRSPICLYPKRMHDRGNSKI